MDKLRILVAHDKLAIARAIEQILATYGFAVEPMTDGDAVAEALRSRHFDGLVVDAAILGTPIHELCELAKAGADPVPAVIMIAAIFRRRSYKRRASSLYGADDVVEVHRIATELPAKLWRLFSGKDLDAAAKAEAEMALWSLHNEPSRGPERLAGLLVAGLVLNRADEVADADDPSELYELFGDDLREVCEHIAGVMGDREHDAAVQASFAAIAG
ncbi:MAG: response regulator transcription factor [Myxococcales bacterium]|nr:response regulator transcription factor [Myxococcales bacterium]